MTEDVILNAFNCLEAAIYFMKDERLIRYFKNNEYKFYDKNFGIVGKVIKNKEIKSSEELKEEEDANLLKEDLQNNVFKKSKKKVSFEKIREKLENRDKFENPKLFYDLLLLAQKGDVELTQNEIMDNKGINVSLKY